MTDVRQSLRKELRNQRKALSLAEQKRAATQLKKHVTSSSLIKKAQHIALYLPNDGEIDPRPIIEWCWGHAKCVYLPVLHPIKNNELWFIRFTPRTPMTRNKYGILEPKGPHRFIRPATQLDVVFLPLVGFDPLGGRLGMGGGYYDRTFSFIRRYNSQKPKLVGLAHELQKVDKLPVESWDVPLRKVITDGGAY